MKRSKIIIDLIKNEIDISQALEILSLLLEDIKDKKIKNWVNKEINGYDSKDELPPYRIVNASLTGTLKSYTQVISHVNIPIDPNEEKILSKHKVLCGINELLQMSEAEKENDQHSLYIPVNIAYINTVALIDDSFEITHASLHLSLYAYTNIIGKLKSKILSILKELEKNYGNLDEYYIDFSSSKKENIVSQKIINIIYKPVSIGDDNKIDKSIIGDDNND